MADQKKEIIFSDSMTLDKRNESFAYLRRGAANNGQPGLYPAGDFVTRFQSSVTNEILRYISTKGEIITTTGGGQAPTYRFYKNLDATSPYHTDNTYGPSNIVFAEGGDGLYFFSRIGGQVYRTNPDSEAAPTVIDQFPESSDAYIGLYDGLYYWWVGSKVWRQLPGEEPELMMTDTGFLAGGGEPRFAVPYKDYIVVFVQRGATALVYFYDKKNTSLFSKRLILNGKAIGAAGVANNRLLLVYGNRSRINTKDLTARMSVAYYDGETFADLNSIVTSYEQFLAPGNTQEHYLSTASAEDYLLCSLRGREFSTSPANNELFKNGVYRIYPNGAIEIADIPVRSDSPDQTRRATVVNLLDTGFELFALSTTSPDNAEVRTNVDETTSFSSYEDYTKTEYITNFYANPFNRHKLTALSFSFEKLYELPAGQIAKLEIWYRTSDRQGWTSLGEITRQGIIDNVNMRDDNKANENPLDEQRYQITKMPNGDALPEFNEIQFKFRSSYGFSVIGAWFEYDYITRNTLR